jgi:ABC-2 type transport system permease protein
MRSLWLVAKHEYRRTVMRRGFIIGTVAIPLGIIALIALAVVVENMGQDRSPLGYVDHSGTLDISQQAALPAGGSRVEIREYADEDTALEALEREEVQAVFVLPPDYVQTLESDLYFLEEPPSNDVWGDFDDFVRVNLLASLPGELQQRLFEGPSITVQDLSSGREFSEENIINLILPFVATFVFFFATMIGAGYMLGIVANEKENRTMEIMVTSVTPVQMIGGKAAGLLAASLSQLAIYVAAAVISLLVAAPYIPELQQATVPWDYLALMVLFFLPAYALISAIMIAIGASVTELQQGQQVAGLLNLVFMLPIFLVPVLFQDPSHPLFLFFTFFPPSSFLTVSMRWGLGTVPMWQVIVSWVILVAAALAMVWVAARVFRAGMLRYGKPLTFRGAVEAVRAR